MSSPAPAVQPAPESWEAVLAAVEAVVNRTEQLLAPSLITSTQSLTPAELMLPAGEDPYLPPLDEMPPVPPELAGRITELRNRIAVLSADLERCLATARRWDRSAPRPLLAAPADEQPHFIDRRA